MELHHSVLLPDAMDMLAPRSGGFYVDGTLGDGGHAVGVLERSFPDGRLLGLDRDAAALERAAQRLAPYEGRVTLRRGRASALPGILCAEGDPEPDGVLLDLGLSSPQLDDAARGFSFMADGPLDMRMDKSQPLTAEELVNESDERDLADIIRRNGEEPRARRVAQAIVAARPLRSTIQLADVVERALGGRRGRKRHPATRVFQAIRIAVNDELNEVEGAVRAALEVVGHRGRVVVIAFHSLEDRIVKQIFAEASGVGTPRDAYGNPIPAPSFRRLTRKPVKGEERDAHARARSARLRAVQRLENVAPAGAADSGF